MQSFVVKYILPPLQKEIFPYVLNLPCVSFYSDSDDTELIWNFWYEYGYVKIII